MSKNKSALLSYKSFSRLGVLRALMIGIVATISNLLRKLRTITATVVNIIIGVLFIVIIMLHAVNSDDSMELIKESLQGGGLETLGVYMAGILGLALTLIYIEKVLKFDQIFNTYKDISSILKEVDNRITDAKHHVDNKNKMNKLMKDIGNLSISKRKVYDIERKSKTTIILSKELAADIQDKQLHQIILTKFRLGIFNDEHLEKIEYAPKEIEYTWYTDKADVTNKIGTLMDSWYEYMKNDPSFHLLDIWKAKNYDINFKQIVGDSHLLIHDINVYNQESKSKSKVIGFIDQGLITHFVNLSIDPDDLLNTLHVKNNSKDAYTQGTGNTSWEDFILKKLKQTKLLDLWRMR